jgi:hypothetical protein
VQVPPQVDLTIRAEIWKAQVRRQLSTLLSTARRELIQVIRQALMGNPLLEAVARAEDEDAPAGEAYAPWLMAAADDLTDGEERYDGIWQACVSDGWDASGLPSQASEAPSASEQPINPPGAIVPDVIVNKMGHAYQVVLNEAGIPRLRLSATSRRMVREGQWGEPEAKPYLDDKLRSAVWLIRSLEHRRQTLLKVATNLVTGQHDFLEHGLAHLKPLTLTEVADALGMHEATVSCVITNKYLATAHGIIALKDFFQRGLESAGGEPQSSPTVKDTQQVIAADVLDVSEEAMGWLERYSWPGNVWELEEVIEQAVARCQGPTVTAQDLPQALREPSRAPVSSGEAITLPPSGIALAELEKQLIRQAIERAHGNYSQAAKLLGLSRTQLRTRMRHYGLE